MNLIFSMIALLLFIVCIGAVLSWFVFLVDVIKWHRAEKRVKIIPSAQQLPDDLIESEVKDNGHSDSPDINTVDDGQSSAPAVFSTWL